MKFESPRQGQQVSRHESIKWTFSLTKGEVEKYRDTLEEIPFEFSIDHLLSLMYQDDDTFNATYILHADYVGQICRVLNAIVKLQQMGVVVEIKEEELNHGHCLIRDVFKAIDKMNKKAKKAKKGKK